MESDYIVTATITVRGPSGHPSKAVVLVRAAVVALINTDHHLGSKGVLRIADATAEEAAEYKVGR